MRKTILSAMLAISSVSLASGSVTMKHEFESEKTTSTKDIKFLYDSNSKHTISAKLSQNKFNIGINLSTKGKYTKAKKEFGKGIEGDVLVEYKGKKVGSSLKYVLDKKEMELNGSYTQKDDVLKATQAVKLTLHDLDPSKLVLSTDLSYKYNDNFTLSNKTEGYTSVNGAKDKIVVPEFLVGELNSNKMKLHGLNSDLSGEYKFNNALSLSANLKAGYDQRSIMSKQNENIKISVEKDFSRNGLNPTQTSYYSGIGMNLKYSAEQFNSELKFGYTYKGVSDPVKIEGKRNKEEEGVIDTKSNIYDASLKLSYKAPITKEFSITPALNVKYDGLKNKYDSFMVVGKVKGSTDYTKHSLAIMPSLSMNYKKEKFDVNLNIEVPINFEGEKTGGDFNIKKYGAGPRINGIKWFWYKHATNKNNLDSIKLNKKFGFKDTNLKATLSIGY